MDSLCSVHILLSLYGELHCYISNTASTECLVSACKLKMIQPHDTHRQCKVTTYAQAFLSMCISNFQPPYVNKSN